MNKLDLIKKISNNIKRRQGRRVMQKDVNLVIDDLVDIIGSVVNVDGEVMIRGFGTFTLRSLKERYGVNPNTGERILIPARREVKFRMHEKLKQQLN